MSDSRAVAEGTTAEVIIDTLIANGVDTVFGLPGAQTYPLFDALYQRKSRVRTVGARHEQGLAYMAFGYARSTGRLGVYAPVPGPGILNCGAGMCTAFGTCAPTLCVTGDVPSDFRGKGRGHLHELRDQLGILERLTRHAAQINGPQEASAAVNRAIAAALGGRPGPSALSVCWDTLERSGPVTRPEAAVVPLPSEVDLEQVAVCVKLIQEASCPMIFTGSGAQHAAGSIAALAERLQAPVVGFRGGRGVVGEDLPLGLDDEGSSFATGPKARPHRHRCRGNGAAGYGRASGGGRPDCGRCVAEGVGCRRIHAEGRQEVHRGSQGAGCGRDPLRSAPDGLS